MGGKLSLQAFKKKIFKIHAINNQTNYIREKLGERKDKKYTVEI